MTSPMRTLANQNGPMCVRMTLLTGQLQPQIRTMQPTSTIARRHSAACAAFAISMDQVLHQ